MPLEGELAPPSPMDWVRDQVDAWERSGRTEALTLRDTGLPVVMVINRGARSGKLHRTPVMRIEHEGSYLAVGSKGGNPKDPTWVANLRTHPQVEVWDGPHSGDYVVREIDDDKERAAWWVRAVAAYPPYAEYRLRTDRVFPMFVLEPA